MTARVGDAAHMLSVLSRPDDRDWYSLPAVQHDFAAGLDAGVKGLRVAVSTTLGYAKVDPEVAKLVEGAADTFTALGAQVERRDPGFADPFDVFQVHWFSGAANQRRSIPADRHGLFDPGFTHIADAGARISQEQYFDAMNKRGALGMHMAKFHREFDILLTPTLPIGAFEAGHVAPPGDDQANWIPWTPFSFPFNLTQQPAASIPCGFTSAGLPVGLQIVAAKYRDDVVLRAARAFEQARPIVLPNVAA
jgi:aspartyl-tRNA(Asn)/glutamyl-tRNA(Gln) amidotransferase subunit A